MFSQINIKSMDIANASLGEFVHRASCQEGARQIRRFGGPRHLQLFGRFPLLVATPLIASERDWTP